MDYWILDKSTNIKQLRIIITYHMLDSIDESREQ